MYVIVGNGQSRLRLLTVSKRRRCWPWDSDDGCTLYINFLTKEVQVMHVQSRKCLFLKKTYCLQIPSTSVPPVHCIDLCMKLHTMITIIIWHVFFKISKCIFSVIIRRLWVICIYINSYTSTCTESIWELNFWKCTRGHMSLINSHMTGFSIKEYCQGAKWRLFDSYISIKYREKCRSEYREKIHFLDDQALARRPR